jgi:mRNA interferase MazF
VVAHSYVPDVGDLVWINFSPQIGHEQAGRRPAVVLSPRLYNEKVGLALMCPVTSRAKGYPFEVALPKASRIRGVILPDHLRSLDWQKRQTQKAGKLPLDTLEEVRIQIATLLGLS